MPLFQMSYLQTDKRIRIGCHRMLVELPEIFQRKKALLGARSLADKIAASLQRTLHVTRNGYENAEDQNETLYAASDELESTTDALKENISCTQNIRIEWTESLDRMDGLISGIREKTGHMAERIEHLENIQRRLFELGFQTKISSLNAIVNAGRTGESGQIFAAVAEAARRGSKDTADHIKEMLEKTDEIHRAMERAGSLFSGFDASVADFRKTAEAIVSLSSDIVADAVTPEKRLQEIRARVRSVGAYTKESKRRYRSIRSKEVDVKAFLSNLDHILSTRMGVRGPYRLNKKISLDNQRINVEGVKAAVDANQETIFAERQVLESRISEMAEADEGLEIISESYGRMIDTVERAKADIDGKLAGALSEITEGGGRFQENIGRIAGFLQEVRKIKAQMQDTILFNGLLPLVADVAALLAPGEHDLRFRVQELEGLLKRLREATREIERFLREADDDLVRIGEMGQRLNAEMEQNRKTSQSVADVFETILKDASRQGRQIESIGSVLGVIRDALWANRECADRIDEETEGLKGAIRDYIAILDRRQD